MWEGATRAPTKDEANVPLAQDLVKKTKAFDFVWSLMQLAFASLVDCEFVNLAIVAAYLLLEVVDIKPCCSHVACNAEGIGAVALGNSVLLASTLCDVPVGGTDLELRVRGFQALHNCLAQDVHMSCVFVRAASCTLQLDRASVQGLVAGRTERNQVIGGISSCPCA